MGEIIELYPNNKSSKKSEDLQNGILTIDRIYNYYRKKEEIYDLLKLLDQYKNNEELEDYYSNNHLERVNVINAINLIKEFPEDYKLYYIELIRKINKTKDIEKELKQVLELTCFYLNMGDQLEEFDYDDIKHYINMIGGKNEDRRL